MASSRTLSPRNSSRSYDSARSSAQEACVNTCSALSAGSSAISRPSSAAPEDVLALMCGCGVGRLADGRELAGVFIRDLQTELVLEVHHDLHQIERVRAEILLEGRLFCDLALVDTELLAQRAFDLLEDLLTGSRHA